MIINKLSNYTKINTNLYLKEVQNFGRKSENAEDSKCKLLKAEEKVLILDIQSLSENMHDVYKTLRGMDARSKEYLGYTKQFDFDYCMDRMEQMIIQVHEDKGR